VGATVSGCSPTDHGQAQRLAPTGDLLMGLNIRGSNRLWLRIYNPDIAEKMAEHARSYKQKF
jgi:hypothetical protein